MILLIALWFQTCGDPIIDPHMCEKYIVISKYSENQGGMDACRIQEAGYKRNGSIQQAMGAHIEYQCRALQYPTFNDGE